MKKTWSLVFIAFTIGFVARAQETIVLAEQAGLKVSYQVEKLEEDKKHDKWNVTILIDNDGQQDIGFVGDNEVDPVTKKSNPPRYLKVEVTNTKGFFSTSDKEFRAEPLRSLSLQGGKIFRVRKGRTTETFKTNIAKGATPAMKANFLANLKPLNEISILRANPAEVSKSGVWFTVTRAGGQTVLSESLNIFSPQNQPASVTYNGVQFTTTIAGNAASAQSSSLINYQGWDHVSMAARYNPQYASWTIYRNGDLTMGATETRINFIGSDGYNYSATVNPAKRNKLMAGEKITIGNGLTSSNGLYAFVHTVDGKYFIYDQASSVLWSFDPPQVNTQGLVMQPDGNAVIYDNTGKAIWSSGTDGIAGAYMVMQNDGNLVIYGADGIGYWCTQTAR